MYLHVQRIRDFFGNALYKFTFYLLTYFCLAVLEPSYVPCHDESTVKATFSTPCV